MSKKVLLLSGAIVFFSYFIFNYQLYWAIVEKTGIAIAYVADQFYPFFITVLLGILFFHKNGSKRLFTLAKQHGRAIIVLLAAMFLVHGLILGFYFFGEEPTSILIESMNQVAPTAHKLVQKLTGYHWGMYVFSYLLFGIHAWMYNVLTLVVFSFAVIALYALLYFLIEKKLPAFLGALFFITTPAYLDTFHWQANASGMSLALLAGLLFLIMLIIFQKTKTTVYFLFALLFFVAMLKISFVRTLGFIAVAFYLFFFPKFHQKFLIKQTALFFLPFFLVWFICFSVQFLIPAHLFDKVFVFFTHPFTGAEDTVNIRVRSEPLHTENYLFTLGTFLSYVFIPTQIAAPVFLWMKTQLQTLTYGFITVSLTTITGSVLLAGTLFVSVISFIKHKQLVPWLMLLAIITIIANMFYIPLFVSEYHSLETLDTVFTINDPGSGPGSRYVFMSSVGLSILVGGLSYWLLKKKKKFLLYGIGGIILFQAFLTIQSHYAAFESAQLQSKLPEQLFSMIPHDKKKKIVFSTNPLVNSIERKIAGEKWLYAFYPNNELVYVNTKEKFLELFAKENYHKENVYAFYNNPQTYSFADVSSLVRNELLDKKAVKPVTLQSEETVVSSIISKSALAEYPFFLQRGVFVSNDFQQRFLLPRKVTFSLEKEEITPEFPYVDVIHEEKNLFPMELWGYKENKPIIDDEEEIQEKLFVKTYDSKIARIPSSDKQAIAEIIHNREQLRLGTQLSFSTIYTEDSRIREKSLLDGIFTTNPMRDSDTYFLAKSSPTSIILRFPYSIAVGRLLLNAPPNFAANMPTDIQVYSSAEGETRIGTLDAAVPSGWSPNKGNLYEIPLEQVVTDSLRIEIKKTTKNPVIFDEIIVDNVNALAYAPDKIDDVGKLTQQYIGDEVILQSLLSIDSFNALTGFYACAEQTDWEKQKKNMSEAVPGIWKAFSISLTESLDKRNLSFPVDCSGSVLRKIVLVAPAYPAKFTINNIVLE